MSEVAVRSDLGQKIEWAKTMSVASLLPREYQNNPGNLLYAIEYADSLGIDRINAITSIHVINGKPSASADLIASLVRKAGHKLRVTGDETHAVAELIRADDPDHTFTARWDQAKATTAKLWGKGNWATYPAAMLRARAITEVVRMGASDALYGLIYTPEELGAQVAESGAPVEATVQKVYARAEPAAAPEPLSKAQQGRIFALLGELGVTDDTDRRQGASAVLGREVESFSTLTKAEGIRLIDSLEAEKAKRGDVVDAEIVADTHGLPVEDQAAEAAAAADFLPETGAGE